MKLEKWLFKWKNEYFSKKVMFSGLVKIQHETSVCDFRLHGNKFESKKEIKILGIKFDF